MNFMAKWLRNKACKCNVVPAVAQPVSLVYFIHAIIPTTNYTTIVHLIETDRCSTLDLSYMHDLLSRLISPRKHHNNSWPLVRLSLTEQQQLCSSSDGILRNIIVRENVNRNLSHLLSN